MARKGSVENNNYRKELIRSKAESRKKLKSIIMNKKSSIQERVEASIRLAKKPRNSSAVRFRTRCAFSQRPRGVYRFCGLSRIALRDSASRGELAGVRRSSW